MMDERSSTLLALTNDVSLLPYTVTFGQVQYANVRPDKGPCV